MTAPELIHAQYDRALAVMRRAAHPAGFVASSADTHYYSVWGRDAAFTLFGAIHTGEQDLVETSLHSLETLAQRQYRDGQITDVYWPDGVAETDDQPYWDCGEAGATDATALFVVACGALLRRHPDEAVRTRLLPHVERAVAWLVARDDNKTGLVDSPQAGDWMDAAFVRSGKVLYVNVLYQRALHVAAELGAGPTAAAHRQAADIVRERINLAFWPEGGANWAHMVGSPYDDHARWTAFPHPATPAAHRAAIRTDRTHYLSHITWGEFVDKCDVLANVLAVLFDIAPADRARTIMRALLALSRRLPHPIATYAQPVAADDPSGMYKAHIDHFQAPLWRNPPGDYHNAGIWPFVGAYYVLALHHCGLAEEAQQELERLAQATAQTRADHPGDIGFNEWLRNPSGEARGADAQAWSAGGYAAAYRAVVASEAVTV